MQQLPYFSASPIWVFPNLTNSRAIVQFQAMSMKKSDENSINKHKHNINNTLSRYVPKQKKGCDFVMSLHFDRSQIEHHKVAARRHYCLSKNTCLDHKIKDNKSAIKKSHTSNRTISTNKKETACHQ